MVQSKAVTVKAYLDELTPEQRKLIRRVRQCIRENIQPGFKETMAWGMIAYEVPLARFPDTYNKRPLLYCSLAAQKRHFAVYLMNIYTGSSHLDYLRAAYRAAGIKLDVGKCCIRFKDLSGIHLPTIGKLVGACSVEEFINLHEAVHSQLRRQSR